MRYNPPFLLGLDLHNPYVEQGLLKLLNFTNHGVTDTMTGNFIHSIEHHQLEIGSFTSIFHLDSNKYSFLASPIRLTVLWEFIAEHDISLRSSQPRQPQPLRQYDVFIMDTLLQEDNVSTFILLSINRVRYIFQLFSLADIATGDGLRIRVDYAQERPGDTVSQWYWYEEHPPRKTLYTGNGQ